MGGQDEGVRQLGSVTRHSHDGGKSRATPKMGKPTGAACKLTSIHKQWKPPRKHAHRHTHTHKRARTWLDHDAHVSDNIAVIVHERHLCHKVQFWTTIDQQDTDTTEAKEEQAMHKLVASRTQSTTCTNTHTHTHTRKRMHARTQKNAHVMLDGDVEEKILERHETAAHRNEPGHL